ncbi:TonB-dependent receptor [Chroogloeocystis siderophila]|uniref:Ferrichrome-iron receptor n=1 Tax=Chroogloeocystis siderophila 5.2 s.c.1 TaxID=247279 RepID=A0A1U7HXP8_9CHRO|nr:TonB-dependent receptor [Chroogloeocystis siderophila]OKH28346.1 ferrichrome-iron receptor [Chroogloeocystis siderophila 5.2 s.c.1]
MQSQQYRLIWIASAFSIIIVSPSWASEVKEAESWQEIGEHIELKHSTSPQEIPALNKFEQPATTLDEWRDQIAQTTIVPITGIRLSTVDVGIEVILETADGQLSEPSTSVVNNTLIVEIPNAVLELPDSNEFQQTNPVEGITLVSVSSLTNNRVRVAITGLYAPPTAKVRAATEGLVLSVASGTNIDEAEDEIQIVVTGEQDRYAPEDATTATRTETPLRDIPQSIQVVPSQVIQDQQANELDEVLRNVSGVAIDSNFAGALDRFSIRGFTQYNILRNGFREGEGGIRETANLERVEVLKGPASVLYGNLQPGGIVNLITKQPLEEPVYSFELSVGTEESIRPVIDFTGSLNQERSLLYRINALYNYSDTFRNFDQTIQRFFVAPVLEWRISDQTNITVEMDYLSDERPFDRGLVAIGDGIIDAPITRILNEPDDFYETEEFGIGYRFEHEFSNNWTLRNAFRYFVSNTLDLGTDPTEFNEEIGELSRQFRSNSSLRKNYSLQTDLAGRFTTGSIEHTLIIGVDLGRVDSQEDTRVAADGFTPSINVFNPEYETIPRPLRSDLEVISTQYTDRLDTIGIFAQDQITLLDNLKVLIGGRFDIVDEDYTDTSSGEEFFENYYDEAFSPRVGIVYQPIEPISLYASYSRSFTPNFGVTVDQARLDPERGTQYELGIRGEFFNSRLISNLAVYEITKSNVATGDPDNPGFSINIGEQRSRGIELDVIGEILPGWNIIAAYAYTDAEITESTDFEVGNRPSNVPKHSGSLWTTYEIQSGNLQGLGFGIGLFFIGERQGNLANDYQLPSYVRTDAAIYYRRDNWRAALNVKNLFDTTYYETADFGRTTIRPGAPLTLTGTIAVEF